MAVLYFVLAIAVGLIVDWAMFERFTFILGAVGAPEEDQPYRRLLFPRVLFTLISSAAIAIGILSSPENGLLVMAGSVIFLATNIYGVVAFLRGNLRR